MKGRPCLRSESVESSRRRANACYILNSCVTRGRVRVISYRRKKSDVQIMTGPTENALPKFLSPLIFRPVGLY